jgi:hypothetical protein
MLISPTVFGMLGWDPDAPNQRARLAPQIPSNWTGFSVENLMVGDAKLGLELIQGEGSLEVQVQHYGPSIDLDLILSLPPGAEDIRFASATETDPEPMDVERGRHDVQVSHVLHLSGQSESVRLRWSGGLAIAVANQKLSPGQESRGLRVLDFGESENGWKVTVEGDARQRYWIELLGEIALAAEGSARIISAGDKRELEVSFGDQQGRSTQVIHLQRAER